MAYIAQWLNEAHQNKMADLVIEDTLSDLTRRDTTILDPYVPLKTYTSRKFLSYVMEQLNTIASVIAYGAEPPVTQHGTFRKITAEMMKSSLAYVWDEEYQWHMKEAMEEAAAKGITVQRKRDQNGKVQATNADLASFIFGTIQQLALAQVELLNHMTWQVLQTGKIDRTDPRTGVKTQISYLNPYGRTATGTTTSGDLHFPDALTGSGGSTIDKTHKWSEFATANGVQNLYDAVDQYVDTNGFAPDYIYMSRKLLNKLMQQASTKDSASSLTVTQVGTVSPAMLGAILEARGIPPIKTYDEKFKNELADQTLSNARFLDDNKFVFVKESMGERAMGPTLENNGKEGVYVTTYEKSKVPPTDVTQTVATILPVFANPLLLFARQVDSV
jgi:alkylhydroperoxidase/carboxymuconolactone decarboxylase family protein YurZ